MGNDESRYYFLGRRRNCNPGAVMVAVLPGTLGLDELARELGRYEAEAARSEASLPPGSGWPQVFARADAFQSAPFDPERGPLEVLALSGAPGGRSALLLRAHRMLPEGGAPAVLFSRAFAPGVLAASAPAPAGDGVPSLLALADADRLRLEAAALRRLLRPRPRWPVVSRRRARRLVGFRIPAAGWREAAATRGGDAEALYLALVARVMRGALESLDAGGGPLRLALSLDRSAGGNGAVPAEAVLELAGGSAELDDLSPMRARLAALGHGGEPALPSILEGTLAQLLPGPLWAAIEFRRAAGCDALASTISLPVEGELLGAPVEMLFIVPPALGQAVSFSLTAHGEHFHLAANADLGAMPVPLAGRIETVLAGLFGDGFESFAEV